MSLMNANIAILTGLLPAFIIGIYLQYSKEDFHCPNPVFSSSSTETMNHCFFSETYFQARHLFLHYAEQANADEIAKLDIDDHHSIDLAVFKGASDRLVLHISGTHGSEGFVGSAIQSKLLWKASHSNEGFSKIKFQDKPTVIFVHALNPFGMSHWRRWNENGVDLNRNAIFTNEEWEEVLGRGDNIAGYEDMDYMFNPEEQPSDYGFWKHLPTIVKGLLVDTIKIKKAAVAGTYSKPGGIFYGGTYLQRSHQLLSEWLSSNNYTNSVSSLSLIDVHSGLDPPGKDSLMFHTIVGKQHSDLSSILLNSSHPPHNIEGINGFSSKDTDASAGYELTHGFVTAGYPSLFHEVSSVVSVTQEFGTRHPLVVLKALIQENQAWKFLSYEKRGPYQKMIYDAFVLKTPQFQDSVLKRGEILFQQMYDTC